MSNRYHLTQQELDELECEHRHASDKRYKDRLKAVYLLGRGWQVSKVSDAGRRQQSGIKRRLKMTYFRKKTDPLFRYRQSVRKMQ